MKKVLNITMIQRILKPSLLVLIIAGSRFLPNASAMRWKSDFRNKPIKASDLNIYTAMLNFGEDHPLWEVDKGLFMSTTDWGSACDSFIKEIEKVRTAETSGIVQKDERDGKSEITIVLENGILDVLEAKKLLSGIHGAFDIEFINCSGTLDLNEDLKKHANSINFQDCKFETAPNCFKNTKHLKFSDTTLTPTNGRLGFDKNASIDIYHSFAFVFSRTMQLDNAIVLEFAAQNPNKKQESVPNNVIESKKNFKTEITPRMEGVKEQLSSLQEQYNLLKREFEEFKCNNKDVEQYKLEVTKLEKKVEEKDRIIGDLSKELKNLQKTKEIMKEAREKIEKKLSTTVAENNKQQKDLSFLYEKTRKQLEDAECNNKMYKEMIDEMKKKNEKLKKKNEKLSKDRSGAMNDLKVSNEKLEALNKELEGKNTELKEKIDNQNETVALANKMVKKYNDLEKEIERLKENSEKKSDSLNEILQQVKTKDKEISKWKKMYATVIDWMKYAHNLITVDLKENAPGTTNILHTKGYSAEIKKLKSAIKEIENGDFKKKDKKGQWIDLDEIFGQKVDDNGQEEDEDEIVWRRGRGRGGYHGNDRGREENEYQEEKKENDKTREDKTVYKKRRGNFYNSGYRGRGGCRGNNYRGRGNRSEPMVNIPRGGKQGGFNSYNH